MKKVLIAAIVFVISLLQLNEAVYASTLSNATEENPCVISAIGDSITYAQTYAAVLDSLPEVTVNNYGISATQVAGELEHSFVNRTNKVKYKSDIILIFGGTNDYMGDKFMCNPMGEPDSTDITTFFGAYNTMIKNIKKYNKKARIVLVTPIKRVNWDAPNAYGLGLQHYVLATTMVAKNNNVDYIDLYSNPECDFTENDLLIDGLHPNMKGHTVIATTIYKELIEIENRNKKK